MRVIIIAPFMRQGQGLLEALRALRPDVNYSVATKRDHIRGQRPDMFIMCSSYGNSSVEHGRLLDEMRIVSYHHDIPVINALTAHHNWLAGKIPCSEEKKE